MLATHRVYGIASLGIDQAIEKSECYNAFMPSEPEKVSENPYEAPQKMSEPQVEAPLPKHLGWALATTSALLLSVVLMNLWWFREFGGAGVAMLIGGVAGSHIGWWMSKERWWGMAGGAIVGFTAGAALGVIWLFIS